MKTENASIDLTVIVVSYNVKPFLEAMLQSVERASEELTIDTIVVDNQSTDGSVEMVRRNYPDAHLICNDSNRGFAAANNQALRVYRGRYACLVNPDVLLQEDTLRVMMTYLDRHKEVGAAGCRIMNPDGSLQLACRRSMPTPASAFFKLTGLSRLFPRNERIGAYNLTHLDPDQAADVDAISGSFMFVRRQAIEGAGLLDERFFMYGEDLDWLLRIRRAGWCVRYLPHTRIVHYKGESARRNRARTFVEFYRAMYVYAAKHRPSNRVGPASAFIRGLIAVGILARGSLSFLAATVRQGWVPLLDLLTVNTTPLVGTLLRVDHLTPLTAESLPAYLVIHGTYSIVWMSCFYLAGLYGLRRMSAVTAAAAVTAGFVVVAALTFYAPPFAFSRVVILLTWLMNLVVIAGWRKLAARSTTLRPRAIIVGTDSTGRGILAHLRETGSSNTDVVGFLDSDPGKIGGTIDSVTVFNGNGKLSDTLDRHKIDEVIVASSTVSYQEILKLVSSCTNLGVGLKLVVNLEEDRDESVPLEMVSLVDGGTEPLTRIRKALRRASNQV